METQAYSILAVDDQLENINQIINGFKANNLPYDILMAFDGEMALKVMEKNMPDLIITDWEMPKMDGITFIKKVKENKNTKIYPSLCVPA